MRRFFFIALIMSASLPLFAQVPAYTIAEDPDIRERLSPGWHTSITIPTKEATYSIAYRMGKREVDQLELMIMDQATGKIGAHTPLDKDLGVLWIIPFNGKLFLINRMVDHKQGTYDLYATPYDAHTLAPLRSPGHIAQLSFKPRNRDAWNKAQLEEDLRDNTRFVPSKDGTMMAFWSTGAEDPKDKKLNTVAVLLDGDMMPIWQSTHTQELSSNTVELVDLAADEAAIHLLTRVDPKNGSATKAVDHDYQLSRIQGEQMTSRPIKLPSGQLPATARMIDGGDHLIVAGFHVDPDRSAKTMVGCFAGAVSKSGDAPDQFTLTPLPLSVELQSDRSAELLQASDGGLYIIGSSYDENTITRSGVTETTAHIEGPILAAAFTARLSSRWVKVIPRVIKNHYSTGIWTKSILVNDAPLVLFTDHPDNARAYEIGERGKASGDDRSLMIAAFDPNGRLYVDRFQTSGHVLTSFSIRDDLGEGIFSVLELEDPKTGRKRSRLRLTFAP